MQTWSLLFSKRPEARRARYRFCGRGFEFSRRRHPVLTLRAHAFLPQDLHACRTLLAATTVRASKVGQACDLPPASLSTRRFHHECTGF
jgi:hypothetical protein